MQSESPAAVKEEDESVREFTSSMSDGYAQTFGPRERAEHAAIAARRGTKKVHLERWRSFAEGGAIVCVVADDRVGLLAEICAAFYRHGLEVRLAEVFSRSIPDGGREAVDLFWLRALDGSGGVRPVEMHHLEKVADTLVAQALGGASETVLAAGSGLRFQSAAARVFFKPKVIGRGDCVLVVEARDYPGLLLAITNAVREQGLVIESSDVRTEGHIARDSFVLSDPSGRSLDQERLAATREAVIAAVLAGPPLR
jgi:UTP:GlnB (protein PII) uridylyltransferase